MGGTQEQPLKTLARALEELVSACRSPAERRIRFGNLRYEISPGSDNGGVTNAAVVYETPGGSTTQINITYDDKQGVFSYLAEDLVHTVTSTDPQEVIDMVRRHVMSIPERRLQALFNTIDIWLSEGKSRHEMFAEMNKLLQSEFLGGRITTDELKAGIQHIVKCFATERSS